MPALSAIRDVAGRAHVNVFSRYAITQFMSGADAEARRACLPVLLAQAVAATVEKARRWPQSVR